MADALEMIRENLSRGTSIPTEDEGDTLKIFGHQFCPFTQRVLIMLALKGVDYEMFWVDLKNKADWLENLNLREKVPVLFRKEGPNPLVESLIIAKYIDEAYTDTGPLISSENAYQYGRNVILIERVTAHWSRAMDLFMNSAAAQPTGEDRAEEAKESKQEADRVLGLVSAELADRETKYIGGAFRPTFVDYMIWPLMERIPSLVAALENDHGRGSCSSFDYVDHKYPRVAFYCSKMREDEDLKKFVLSNECLYDFLAHANEILSVDAFKP